MPENAAAEGGFGLGVSEAFGGQVGTGNVSASEVGGTFGGFGPDFGGGADDPSQSGQFGMGTPTPGNAASNAEALAARAENLAQQAAANRAAAAAATGMRGKAASNLGIGTGVAVAQAQNAVNAAMSQNGMVTGQDVAAIAAATGLAPGLVSGLAQEAVANAAANAAANANAATKGSGLGIGSMMDESINPTVSTTTGMVGVDENGNIVSYGIDVPEAPVAPEAPTAPTISEDVMSLAPISVTAPPTISEDLMSLAPTTIDISSTRPQARPEDDRSFIGRMTDELGMIFSTNPFASREDQAQSLIDKGYNPTDVSNFMARSINTDRASRAAVENQIGAGGPDEDMIRRQQASGQQASNTVSRFQPSTIPLVAPDLLTSSEMLLNGVPISDLVYSNDSYGFYPYRTSPSGVNLRQQGYDELAARNSPFRFIV